MANGPTASSASETAAANVAIALTVTPTARRKPGTSSVAESSVKWGRIAVWIAWNSISGARAISTTLNAKPAIAVASALEADFTINGPAFRKACSHTMIRSTAVAKPAPWASVNSVSAGGSSSAATSAASATRTSRVDGVDCTRTRRAGAHGTTSNDRTRATGMPGAHTGRPPLPCRHEQLRRGHAQDREQREREARRGLHEHEHAVEREPAAPGEEAAREVRRRVRRHGDDEHPIERRLSAEEVVLKRTAQRQHRHEEERGERELDGRGHAQVLVAADAARIAVGDRARQHLLDGPVEDRADEEDRRPQEADAAVVAATQLVRGEREVRLCYERCGDDPDAGDARAAGVGAPSRCRHGPEAWSTGTASGALPPSRTA